MLVMLAEPGVAALFDLESDAPRRHDRTSIIRQQAHDSCIDILDVRIADSLKIDIHAARGIADARCQLLTGLVRSGPAPLGKPLI